jgi:hypothetical protein
MLSLQEDGTLTCFEKCALNSRVGRLYLAIATLESIAMIAAGILGIVNHAREPEVMMYMCVLCIYTALIFVYFTWDSVIRENVFQYWASFSIHLLILMFGTYFLR